mmetsp:Transcript_53888/g.98523  ORF Transcript_53888/g.98523 Transcript_53888/m.98523 type:complete len:772 (-) Transcript_53888:84-2399(-)
MAKLFEEVISGSASSSSADIIIHFSCSTEPPKNAPAEGSTSPVPGCGSTRGQTGCFGPLPRCGNDRLVYREVSPGPPRNRMNMNSCSMGSPNRILSPLRPTPVAEVEKVPGPLRCHSLVLQTQPTLLEKLVPSNGRGRQTSGEEPLSEGVTEISDTGPVSSSSEAFPPPQEGDLTLPSTVLAEHTATSGTGMVEVTVDDEPEIFLEMIKFVYLNTCNVDQSNVKALMLVADKYNIEDIVRHCLQWMEDHFTANLFYLFLTFRLPTERSRRLLLQSLLRSLRSRRHFTLVTEDADGRWEQLPVSFMEALLSSNHLPVVSEAEVLNFLARWAAGVLARQETESAEPIPVDTTFTAQAASPEVSQLQGAVVEELEGGVEGVVEGGVDGSNSNDSGGEGSNSSGHCLADGRPREEVAAATGAPEAKAERSIAEQRQEQMLRLLRTFRKSDITVKMTEIEPILKLLQLDGLFSNKPPRETAALDPGFMIYRGVAGVNVPAPFGGGLTQPDVVPHAWKSGAVVLGSHDFLQQQDGFRPFTVPGGDGKTFPRLWTRIKCPSWSHLQKRASSSTKGHVRHSVSGPVGGDFSSCDSVAPSLTSMPLLEGGNAPPMGINLKTMQSQDDWDIGRKHTRQSATVVPNISENEKIEHRVIAAVLCGHVRHGIRICQRERSSIYYIEELDLQVSGQSEEVTIGGSPTEVEFELQLTAQAPDHCGICQCVLAVLPAGLSEANQQDTLMQIVFKSSAEEPLHFQICSSHFDFNSSYSVELAWVLPSM